jgi:hypothetical protein
MSAANGYSIMSDGTIFTITKDDTNGTCVKKAGEKKNVEDFLNTVAPTETATATGVATGTPPTGITAPLTAISSVAATTAPADSKLDLSIEAKKLAQSALDLINSSTKLQMTDGVSEQEKKDASEQAIQAKTLAEEAITKAETAIDEPEETKQNNALTNITDAKSLLGKSSGGSRSANKKNKTCKKKGGKKHKKSQKHKKAKKC